LDPPPPVSDNGQNRCWLNAPLYTILSDEDTRNKLQGCNNNNNDVVELKKFLHSATVWNEKTYNNFIQNIKMNIPADVSKESYGDPNDAFRVLQVIFEKCNIPYGSVPVEANDNPDFAGAIAIVSSTECFDPHKPDQGAHFISFVKKSNQWYKVDALENFKPEQVNKNDIINYHKCNNHSTDRRAMFNIYNKNIDPSWRRRQVEIPDKSINTNMLKVELQEKVKLPGEEKYKKFKDRCSKQQPILCGDNTKFKGECKKTFSECNQSGGGNYQHKYEKYKTKYEKLKKLLNQ